MPCSVPGQEARCLTSWLVANFSRVTSSGPIIREIDGFRFLAITAVIAHHLVAIYLESTNRFAIPPQGWQRLKTESFLIRLVSPGWFGVNLFFVISGFVLALPFARHYLNGARTPSLKAYYLRRLTRIEPPYFIALTISMAVVVATRMSWRDNIANFFASLFYVHNLIYGEMSHIESIFWSLEVEVQFYLIAPVLASLFAIKSRFLRRGTLVGLVFFWGWFAPGLVCVASQRASLSIVCNLQYFVAGFLLLDFYLEDPARLRNKGYSWDAMSLATAAAIFLILDGYWIGWLLPFLIVLFYLSLFLGRLSSRFVTHPAIYIIGGMCYTLYLYHVLIIKQLGRWTFALASPDRPFILDLLIQATLLGALILVLGVVLFKLFERPFMGVRVYALKPKSN